MHERSPEETLRNYYEHYAPSDLLRSPYALRPPRQPSEPRPNAPKPDKNSNPNTIFEQTQNNTQKNWT